MTYNPFTLESSSEVVSKHSSSGNRTYYDHAHVILCEVTVTKKYHVATTPSFEVDRTTPNALTYCNHLAAETFQLAFANYRSGVAKHMIIIVSNSFLLLVVRHLLLEAMHLFLVADCF